MNRTYQKDLENVCEYLLPDYMGDVKRILTFSALPLPSGKFVGDGSVDFSGTVSYDVLYSDTDGRITRVNTSSDYSVSCAVSGEEYVDAMAEIKTVNVSVRPSGPRKLCFKAALSATVRVCENEALSVGGTAFSLGEPEIFEKRIRSERANFSSENEKELSEELEKIEGMSAEDVEIISSFGNVRIKESEAVAGGVTVRGDIILGAIISTEGQPPYVIKKTVPFDEKIELEGVNENSYSMASARVGSVVAGAADDGECATVSVTATACFSCIASENVETGVPCDAYLKNRDTSCEYEQVELDEILYMNNLDYTRSASLPRSEIGCDGVREVMLVNAEARVLSRSAIRERVELGGEILFSGVACEINGDNLPICSPLKFTVPFSAEVDCGSPVPDGARLEGSVTVVDAEPSLDSERLNIAYSLSLALRVVCPHSARRVRECNVCGEAEYSSTRSVITVYYPDGDENLFDIAKRYHTTCARLAEDNALADVVLKSPDSSVSLYGVKRLIIK